MTVVPDASALVEYLLRTIRSTKIQTILESERLDWCVPALCDVEVVSALRRALMLQRLSEARATDALTIYLALPLTRFGHEALLGRMLALRRNFSAYDAVYVALAEALEAPLLTGDDRLARAVKAHTSVSVLP